jgi:hypothetical protein
VAELGNNAGRNPYWAVKLVNPGALNAYTQINSERVDLIHELRFNDERYLSRVWWGIAHLMQAVVCCHDRSSDLCTLMSSRYDAAQWHEFLNLLRREDQAHGRQKIHDDGEKWPALLL